MSSLSWSGAHLSGLFLTAPPMTRYSPVFAMQHIVGVPHVLVRKSFLGMDLPVTRTLCSPGPNQPREKRPEAAALGLYHRLPVLGRTLGHTIQQQAASTAKAWWDRYEEFVGLNEVREAQGNVTEVRRGARVLAFAFVWGNRTWAPNKTAPSGTCDDSWERCGHCLRQGLTYPRPALESLCSRTPDLPVSIS